MDKKPRKRKLTKADNELITQVIAVPKHGGVVLGVSRSNSIDTEAIIAHLGDNDGDIITEPDFDDDGDRGYNISNDPDDDYSRDDDGGFDPDIG